MKQTIIPALLACGIAALVTNLLIPLVVRIAEALRAIDHPGGRKRQEQPVPRLGGLAIAIGLALGAGSVAMLQWGDWGAAIGQSQLVALAIGTLMVFLVGLVDDVTDVGPGHKLLIEVAAAYLLVRLGWSFQVLMLPGGNEIQLGVFGDLISLLWIVGVTNAINLIDGLDGLAGGVVTIIAASLLVYSVFLGPSMLFTIILMGAVVGSCLGFLRHNWAPARIFMGDSGSLTLGFLLAVMSIHSALKAPAAVAILVPILALGVPVMDTLMVMLVRFVDRRDRAFRDRFEGMFQGDRRHLHHMLGNVVANRKHIVTAIYAVVVAFCAMALLVAWKKNTVLGVQLMLIEFAAIIGIRLLGMTGRAKRLSLRKRREAREEIFEVPADAEDEASEGALEPAAAREPDSSTGVALLESTSSRSAP